VALLVESCRGRYAPSPTGRLHLGNARTALLAWLAARLGGCTFVLRIEDLDRGRARPEAEGALLDDLRWLGIDWDEGPDRPVGGPGGPGGSDGAMGAVGGSSIGAGPFRQSERGPLYAEAVARLLDRGLAFRCACSRAEVARAASAPHPEDDEGPPYPGTCRDLEAAAVLAVARAAGRQPSVRLRASAFGGETFPFVDRVCGPVDPFGPPPGRPGSAGLDDFVLQRADGLAAYQLAVVVDDAAMGIGEVVRGDDLLRSTSRQLALYQAFGWSPPAFAHVPLLLAPDGLRLAKRAATRPPLLCALRDGEAGQAGIEADRALGRLAASAGLCAPGERMSARELLAHLGTRDALWSRLARQPVVWA
jgi:glutamyl-tRNA synthetase